jgi:RimJ/RimL family protein N-acetyltransferase
MDVKKVPPDTIKVFARSIHDEATQYGFGQLDLVRLINELMDLATIEDANRQDRISAESFDRGEMKVDSLPLRSSRLEIRLAEASTDLPLLNEWMRDDYGKHFLLSCLTAQEIDIEHLLSHPANQIGIVSQDGVPIGAVAYLDIDKQQRRAELRKLIGVKTARGQGFAEEATRLWVKYGRDQLGLEKIYVSTLQTHLRNIQLNESIGFRVEGLLRNEVSISGRRFDVLRMGLDFAGQGASQ